MEQRLIDGNLVFEYIQKEKAWKQGTQKQPRYDKGKYDAYYEMLGIIKNSPTIDPLHALGACYCRECKHAYINSFSAMQGTVLCKYWTNRSEGVQAIMSQDGFCSYGIPKEQEATK